MSAGKVIGTEDKKVSVKTEVNDRGDMFYKILFNIFVNFFAVLTCKPC